MKVWGVAVSRREEVGDFEIRVWPGRHGSPEPPPEYWKVRYFKNWDATAKYIEKQMAKVSSTEGAPKQ